MILETHTLASSARSAAAPSRDRLPTASAGDLRSRLLIRRRGTCEHPDVAPAAARRGVIIFSGGGAPAAARGVRHALDDVALATARCAPNMFSNEAPTAARGVLFAVTPLPWLRQASTATPRFWVRFEKAFPRHVVAPTAARGVAHVLPGGEPSAPRVAAGLLRGATGSRVPNKPPNDVAIIQAPVLEWPAVEHELCYAWQRMTR